MAGFLRRKSKNQERERAPAVEPSNGSKSTPIFARLTTSSTSSGQQPHHARSTLQGHVTVSQPRILGSTGPHRAVTLNRTTDPGRQLSLRHDARGTPGQSAYPQSKTQQAQVSRTASATVTTPSQRQVAKSLRRVPALQEKPLPTPVPEDDDPPIATVQTNEQTSLTQRGLSTASPPSAHEIRAQQYKEKGVTIDSPPQLQENQVFGQLSTTPMPPPDSGVVDNAIQHPDPAREPALAPKHTVGPPHQTENRQVAKTARIGDAFVDAAEEIKETTPALDAGEASPEIMLYRSTEDNTGIPHVMGD
ncbi:hypothetical protein F5887DRAFT_915851 [Amanita rubescens]|nr:hypothetical protein F5887DRAFT_915851 [Amanita rubescens]